MTLSALAAAVRTLINDPDLRRRLGLTGARRAASSYSWRHVADLLLPELYVRIVEHEKWSE